MKPIFLLTISLFFNAYHLFSQCSTFNQKIQTPECVKPSDAATVSVTCNALNVKWAGSSSQSYVVVASYKDPSAEEMIYIPITDIACDINNNCTATIPVVAGTQVTWRVQGACPNGNRNFYSYPLLGGKDILIPDCEKISQSFSTITNIFPNPSTGSISIEYHGMNSGNVEFIVYDVMQKIVFTQIEHPDASGAVTYQFNLAYLPSGVYLLEARSGNDVSSNKFMIQR